MRIQVPSMLFAVMSAAAAMAQTPAQFEVASVRENTLDDRIVTINVGPGGRFAARGYTLVLLMQRAFGVMDWNVTGGPDWIRTVRFDVAAKAETGRDITEKQLQPMLQRLLADRFKLRVHESTREIPGYALVAARGGAKIQPSADGQEHQDSFRYNSTGLSGQGISMPDLARFVAGKLGLIAVDETGLKGFYDLNAEWKAETDPSPNFDTRDAMRFAVFTAMQEQLGLKMMPKRIRVRTIVIDSVEKASAAEN